MLVKCLLYKMRIAKQVFLKASVIKLSYITYKFMKNYIGGCTYIAIKEVSE